MSWKQLFAKEIKTENTILPCALILKPLQGMCFKICTLCKCSNISASHVLNIEVLKTQWLTDVLEQGLTYYSIWPQAVLINKVLLEYSPKHTIYGCFHATVCRVKSLLRKRYGPQSLNIYYLTMYRKVCWSPILESAEPMIWQIYV